MYTKVLVSSKIADSEFTVSNSYTRSTESSLYIVARSGDQVEVFTTTDGSTWTSEGVVDATSGFKGFNLNLGASVTHVNFVSSDDRTVFVYPLEHGLSPDSATTKPVLSGAEISTSEHGAITSRLSSIEAISMSHRGNVTVAPAVAAGSVISLGADFSSLVGKNLLLSIDGKIIHGDDFSIHPDGDGKITLAFPLPDSPNIFHCMVWE